jgi:hypothetical protein
MRRSAGLSFLKARHAPEVELMLRRSWRFALSPTRRSIQQIIVFTQFRPETAAHLSWGRSGRRVKFRYLGENEA